MKIFSIWERHKSRHKFGGTKISKAEEVRKYFVNLKIVIRFFGYIICNLDFNTSCTLFLLHMKIVSFCGTYWLSISYFLLLCVFCLFLFFFIFFLAFLWVLLPAEVLRYVWWYWFGWTNRTRFSLRKILVTPYLHFPLTITCCRVSLWN